MYRKCLCGFQGRVNLISARHHLFGFHAARFCSWFSIDIIIYAGWEKRASPMIAAAEYIFQNNARNKPEKLHFSHYFLECFSEKRSGFAFVGLAAMKRRFECKMPKSNHFAGIDSDDRLFFPGNWHNVVVTGI